VGTGRGSSNGRDGEAIANSIWEVEMKTLFVAIMCSALIGSVASVTPALAQAKTARACADEWRANRAANQTAGITAKAYIEKCRSGGTVGLQGAPAIAPTAAPAQPKPDATTAGRPVPAALTPATGANQFASEAQARIRCPSDAVVWANLDSKIYHFSGNRDYGSTKKGAYMCEKDAVGQGMRAAKNEKHS
jgi:hypothetical protein